MHQPTANVEFSALVSAIEAALNEADGVPAREAAVARLQQRFTNSVRRLMRQYNAGLITKPEMVTQVQKKFELAATSAFLNGKKGVGPFGITRDDREALREEVARDLARLEMVPSNQWGRRLHLYAARLRSFQQLGRMRAYLDSRLSLNSTCWWVFGNAEHCEDCILLADQGPYRVADLLTENIFPASGHTLCGVNCKCSLVFSDSLSGPNPVPSASLRGFRTKEPRIIAF